MLLRLERLPPGVPIITNEGTALMIYFDRATHDLPSLTHPAPFSRIARFGVGETDEN